MLAETAQTLAAAVATVTELVIAERGENVVVASLARAGTPVGILMRRWARYRHGLELPHYAVSIVRDRGTVPQRRTMAPIGTGPSITRVHGMNV